MLILNELGYLWNLFYAFLLLYVKAFVKKKKEKSWVENNNFRVMATGKPPKPRRIRMPGMRSGSDDLNIGVGSLSLSLSRSDAAMDNPGDSALPPAFRNRLYELFNQIEREFEALYSENLQCNAFP